MGLLANSCFVGRYSTPGGRLSRGRPWQSTPAERPRIGFGSVQGGWGFTEIKPGGVRLLENFCLPANPGMLAQNGGKSHYHADFRCAHRRLTLGLDRRRRHPPDVAHACAVERLSPAPMGYRRLSGALVR